MTLREEFKKDLANAKSAERLVRQVFSSLTTEYSFEDVSEIPTCYSLGDIKATNKTTGKEIYIEVKDDSRIADTYNILCEDEVYYKDSDYYAKGNMHSNYDIYCVVSQQARKIYVLDFSVLRKIYKKGDFKVIRHPRQESECYLLPLCYASRDGALITTVNY